MAFAAACVALLSDWALEELGLGRIEIRADARNVASRRTAVAAGYRFEGVLRRAMAVGDERVDDVLFSLVPGDPRPWHAEAAGAADSLGWPRLTDGRLVVRPFEPDDAPAVQAACDDQDVAHGIFGLPTPYRLVDAEAFIADARHRLLLGERARLAVTGATSDELLGSVSLDRFTARQAAEIGYWVEREARRRGVALGAARLVVAWAFGELGVERLELLTYPGNEASQAIAARLGFRRECLLRGFLPPEQGKGRDGAGCAVSGRQTSAPRRPGAVRAPAVGPGAIRLRTKREAPDLAEPAPLWASHPNASLSIQRTFSMRSLSGLSPDPFSAIRRTVSLEVSRAFHPVVPPDPANRLDEECGYPTHLP